MLLLPDSVKLNDMIAKSLFRRPVERTEKLQTQLSAYTLIVRLIGMSIVCNINTVTEISLHFFRWTQIAETVEVNGVVCSLRVSNPMSTRSHRVVQIHDTAFVTTYSRRKRVTHEHTSKKSYARTHRRLEQLFVRGRSARRKMTRLRAMFYSLSSVTANFFFF